MRSVIVIPLIAIVAAIAVLHASAGPTALLALDATPTASPTAADAAELADLRNRVAALSTQVAILGGADADGIKGRLGGSRAGFDDRYGPPSGYRGIDQVSYDAPGIGVLIATFVDDRATKLTIAPGAAPAATPVAANMVWSAAQANATADELLPKDAVIADYGVVGDGPADFEGTSELLLAALSAADAQGCKTTGALPFTVAMTATEAGTISSLTIETSPPNDAIAIPLAPVEPEDGQLRQGNLRAVANASLGGAVSVNGVTVVATAARPNAHIGRPAAAGYQFLTVDLSLRNESGDVVNLKPGDLLLIDRKERELSAICGGAEPPIANVELAPGDAVDGVVTFQVPEKFRPERLVVLVNGARVGFSLR